MTIGINVGRRWKSLHGGIYSGAFFAISIFSSASAYAVSDSVKSACRNDYFQHCSQFMVGSDELRQCMRSVGEDLSTPCLVALVQEGEITKADVERHNAAKAEPGKKRSSAVASDDSSASDAVTASSKKKHATKTAKTHNAGRKSGTKAKTKADKAPTKKIGKKATAAQATAVTAPTASKTKAHSKKKKHAKSKAAPTTSRTATSKTGTKKKSTATAAKAKKTAKKKATTKRSTEPVDATAP